MFAPTDGRAERRIVDECRPLLMQVGAWLSCFRWAHPTYLQPSWQQRGAKLALRNDLIKDVL